MKIIGKVAIKAGNKYLVLLRSNHEEIMPHAWDFPGGALDPGEDINAALSRETAEETGLKIKILKKQANYKIIIKGLPYYFVIYEAKIVSGTSVVLSKEHSDYKWADKNELLSQNLNTFLKLYLEDLSKEALS